MYSSLLYKINTVCGQGRRIKIMVIIAALKPTEIEEAPLEPSSIVIFFYKQVAPLEPIHRIVQKISTPLGVACL